MLLLPKNAVIPEKTCFLNSHLIKHCNQLYFPIVKSDLNGSVKFHWNFDPQICFEQFSKPWSVLQILQTTSPSTWHPVSRILCSSSSVREAQTKRQGDDINNIGKFRGCIYTCYQQPGPLCFQGVKSETCHVCCKKPNIPKAKHHREVRCVLSAVGGQSACLLHAFVTSWNPSFRNENPEQRLLKDLSCLIFEDGLKVGEGTSYRLKPFFPRASNTEHEAKPVEAHHIWRPSFHFQPTVFFPPNLWCK